MYFFTIGIVSIFLASCNCKCDKNNKKLLDLKTDVEKIGTGFENLAFDVMEQIIDKVSAYEVNGDYYNSEESSPKEASLQEPKKTEATTLHPATKKVMHNLQENTTQVYTTQKTLVDNEKINVIHKRSVDDSEIVSNQIPENAVETTISEPNPNNITLCSTKTAEERNLERQHIEALKEEVKKLYDLVVLLKDQQKIMSLLDKESNHLDSDLSKRFNTKDLLKILNRVNNKDTLGDDSLEGKKGEENIGERATHVELERIKIDLRSAIAALNKTKEILAMERRKELTLEDEIKDHKIELNFLKLMIQKLYENHTGFHPKKFNSTEDILGATPPHLPKELPTRTKLSKSAENKNETTKPIEVNRRSSSSELDDLERIIHKLRKPKKDDLESRVIELKQEMEKKKQEEGLMKQIELLQKVVAEQKEAQTSKSLPDDDLSLKKILEALKDTDKPQGKGLDDDVEVELQKLQKEIDSLRPKDDLNVRPQKDEAAQLRQLLSKLMKQESKKDEDINISNKNAPLTAKQIAELRKQLDQMSADKGITPVGPIGGNGYPGGGGYGYGYGPQFADLFGRGPPSQFLSGGFGSLPHPYPTYTRTLNSGSAIRPPSNNPFNGYLPPNGNYQSQNFGSNLDIRPNGVAIGQGSSGYNRNILTPSSQSSSGGSFGQSNYQSSSDTQQKQFGGSANANQYGFGATSQQSTSEGFKGQLPFNQYGSGQGSETYQGLSEFHQRLFGGQSSFKPAPYAQGGQGSVEKETKNQFFLAPQQGGYDRPAPGAGYAQGGSSGGGQGKPGDYSQQNTGGVDYRYQKIEELRTQVESLQNVINGLNKPDYVQKPEDQQTIMGLERQINELKGIIHGLTQDLTTPQQTYPQYPPTYDQTPPQQQQPPNYPSRRRRSVEDNQLNPEDSDLYDQVVLKLKNVIFDNHTEPEAKNNHYEDVQRKITDLKSQLESQMRTSKAGQERHFSAPNLYPQTNQGAYYNQFGTELPIPPMISKNPLIKSKKNDIFTAIVLKIIDKLLAATPDILGKLFGFGFGQLFGSSHDTSASGYGNGYNNGYDVGYGGYGSVVTIFKNLGIFGYIPLVILKIIDALTAFVKVLRKNKFFKNFLLPAVVLLVVSGSVLFLIWWLQPDSELIGVDQIGFGHGKDYGYGYKNYDYNKNYEPYPSNYNGYDRPPSGYGNSEYYGPRSSSYNNNNYPEYSGRLYSSYGNNEYYGPKTSSYNNPAYSRSYLEYRR